MIDVTNNERAREMVCRWLEANGVPPRITPVHPRASIADGRLTLLQKVQRDGRDVIDPEDPTRIMTETITVPVLVEPDDLVKLWLTPKCPECGR